MAWQPQHLGSVEDGQVMNPHGLKEFTQMELIVGSLIAAGLLLVRPSQRC
jgi:hypothetical protein